MNRSMPTILILLTLSVLSAQVQASPTFIKTNKVTVKIAAASPLILPLAAVVVPGPVAAVAASERILSFNEWKTLKVNQSNEKIRQLSAQFTELRKMNPKAASLVRFQQELNQEYWNLEVARDLAPRDYMLLYVKNRNSKLKMQQIAALMSPDEMSQFLESYIQVIDRSGAAPSYSPRRMGGQAQ